MYYVQIQSGYQYMIFIFYILIVRNRYHYYRVPGVQPHYFLGFTNLLII